MRTLTLARRRLLSRRLSAGLETLESRQLMSADLSNAVVWNLSGTDVTNEVYVARSDVNKLVQLVTPQASVTNRIPAEWERHDSTWMQWPKGKEKSYRENFAGIIRSLQSFEPVHLVVESSAAQTEAQNFLKKRSVPFVNIQFHIMPYDWSWMRDNGAIWVEKIGASGQKSLAVQDWGFDGWGGDGGPSRKDDAVPSYVAKIKGVDYEKIPVVLEKGTLEFNGKDTLITSWTVLHDRNPTTSRLELEQVFKSKFGVSKIVWVEGASQGDITDGHIDGIARFINENTVVVSRYKDQSDPDAALFEKAAATIKAAGLNVVRLDIPGYVKYRGVDLQANYANYLVANNVVIASSFGNAAFDNNAQRQLQQLFPGRKVIMTDTRELWYNGGAVHCVTNDQPWLNASAPAASRTIAPATIAPATAAPIGNPLVLAAMPSQGTALVNSIALKSNGEKPLDRMDVNRDGQVSAIDALMVINQMNRSQTSLLRYGSRVDQVFADLDIYDVNGDGILSPLDVLLVINRLNRNSAT